MNSRTSRTKEGVIGGDLPPRPPQGGEQATGQQQAAQGQGQPHKESEVQRFKEYMAEEKKLDQEGKEYGGLM